MFLPINRQLDFKIIHKRIVKKYIITSLVLLLISVILPLLAHAQSGGGGGGGSPSLVKLVQSGTKVLDALIPFAIGLGLVVFLFAIIKYVTAGSGEDKAAARNLMIYGIIALFVMVSVWGLVNFIGGALGIDQNAKVLAPSLPELP